MHGCRKRSQEKIWEMEESVQGTKSSNPSSKSMQPKFSATFTEEKESKDENTEMAKTTSLVLTV